MTISEAAIERSRTHSIKIGYWNVGLQESQLDGYTRENQLRKLKDVADLWVKHGLHAVCLCEVGEHNIGFRKDHYHKVVEDRICDYIRELQKAWVTTKRMRDRTTEPALRTYRNNSYMMVCDEHCIRIEDVPKAVYISQDGYRHYVSVVVRKLSADDTQQSQRVLAVNAHAPDSTEYKLTDAIRRQMIRCVLEDAAGGTEGRLILGGDLNTDSEMIQELFGSTDLHMLYSKSSVRRRGDFACVSGLLAKQSQSNIGRSFQGTESASDNHDAVVVDAVLLPSEARAEQNETSSSVTAWRMSVDDQAEKVSSGVVTRTLAT